MKLEFLFKIYYIIIEQSNSVKMASLLIHPRHSDIAVFMSGISHLAYLCHSKATNLVCVKRQLGNHVDAFAEEVPPIEWRAFSSCDATNITPSNGEITRLYSNCVIWELSSSPPSQEKFFSRESQQREVRLVAYSRSPSQLIGMRVVGFRAVCSRFLCVCVHQEVKFLCRPTLLIGTHAHTQHGKLNFRVYAIVLLPIKFTGALYTTMKGSDVRDLGHATSRLET